MGLVTTGVLRSPGPPSTALLSLHRSQPQSQNSSVCAPSTGGCFRAAAVQSGRLDAGYDYLTRSIAATPHTQKVFSDPHIMLFNLYWKYHYGGEGYVTRCIDVLWGLMEADSPR